MLKMTKEELKLIVEEAFDTAQKDSLSPKELKELVNYQGGKGCWGGVIFNLIHYKIIERDLTQNMNCYKLVRPVWHEKKIDDEYFIVLEKSNLSFKVNGLDELNQKVDSLLSADNCYLKIYKLVETAKAEKSITRKKCQPWHI
jgi:hypothetical protein